ncbi:hypothetical protein OYC64_014877 [Pagothenia borchgrevinki]|uniref:Uncharacterized protein n=1 Tax=Pagothenia borchgrevinki TaxID=8213 RepID=A0ABD2H4Z0_PAGBO
MDVMQGCAHQGAPPSLTGSEAVLHAVLSCYTSFHIQPETATQQPATYLQDGALPHLLQPWPPQKHCFQTEVTLNMFQLICYPGSKDRGASSNCIETAVYTWKGGSRHRNHATEDAQKLLWLMYLCQLDGK